MGNTMLHKKIQTTYRHANHPARALVFQPRLARATVSAFRISLRKISFLAFPLMKCEQVLNKMKTDRTDRTDTAV